ncbi:MAG: hypothetical protein RLP09_32425 [Sandaracinaceae bacterium]
MSYADRADSLGERIDETRTADVTSDVARYLLLNGVLAEPDEVPAGCPDTICTRERARELQRQRRRARPYVRQGRRALQRHARSYREAKAERLDQALTGTRIDGTVRAEGQENERLVLRYALCSRPVAEAMFLESRATLEREGFEWVGCRSYFRRYGWDLSPPALEEQTIIDSSVLR